MPPGFGLSLTMLKAFDAATWPGRHVWKQRVQVYRAALQEIIGMKTATRTTITCGLSMHTFKPMLLCLFAYMRVHAHKKKMFTNVLKTSAVYNISNEAMLATFWRLFILV